MNPIWYMFIFITYRLVATAKFGEILMFDQSFLLICFVPGIRPRPEGGSKHVGAAIKDRDWIQGLRG